MRSEIDTGARGARTDVSVIGKRKWNGLAFRDECEGRFGFVHFELRETDGLVEAVGASRLEAGFLELFYGVGLRFLEAFAARVAAFERIVGKKFYVRPPRVAVEVRGGRRRAVALRDRSLLGGRGKDNYETKE